ncbi:MAG: hypothetical protein KGI59_03330 [Patescibacteria group bacterium]|nr:hypothetical protein [Patescibacteria group bacterium]
MKKALKAAGAALVLAVIAGGALAPAGVAIAQSVPVAAGNCTPGTTNCDYLPLTTIPGAYNECKPDYKKDSNGNIVSADLTRCQPVNPVGVLSNVYIVSIAVAAVLATGMIIWAGIEYVTVESFMKKSDAKARITGAITGLVLLLSSYIILKTINVDLVNINLDLGTPITGTTAASVDALAGTVDIINKQAEQAAAQSAQAAKDLTDAQAKQKSITDQSNILSKQLQDLVASGKGNSKEAADLRSQISAINDQQAQAQTAVINAKNMALSADINNTQSLVAQQSLDAIKNGGDAASIKRTVATAATKLASLKENGASADQIKTATDQVRAANILALQAQNAIPLSYILRSMKEYTVTVGVDASTQMVRTIDINAAQVIQQRNQILHSTDSIILNMQETDPSVAKVLIDQSNAQIGAIDQMIAQKKGCKTPSNGVHISGNTITCID